MREVMSEKEMLTYLIKRKGDCEELSCLGFNGQQTHCPIGPWCSKFTGGTETYSPQDFRYDKALLEFIEAYGKKELFVVLLGGNK